MCTPLVVGRKYKVVAHNLDGEENTESGLYMNETMKELEGNILTIRRKAYTDGYVFVEENEWTWDGYMLVPMHSKKLIGGELC